MARYKIHIFAWTWISFNIMAHNKIHSHIYGCIKLTFNVNVNKQSYLYKSQKMQHYLSIIDKIGHTYRYNFESCIGISNIPKQTYIELLKSKLCFNDYTKQSFHFLCMWPPTTGDTAGDTMGPWWGTSLVMTSLWSPVSSTCGTTWWWCLMGKWDEIGTPPML